MIAYLRGTLEELHEDSVVVDVQGVGYEVFLPQRLLARLPPVGEPIHLFTHEQVRETGHQLFGFTARQERSLFQMLIQVSGVGPRTALNLLGLLGTEEFLAAIQQGDVSTIARAPGIGRKTAQRVIVDLQAKVGALQPLALGKDEDGVGGEATRALVALGATEEGAQRAVREALRSFESEPTIEELIAQALRLLSM